MLRLASFSSVFPSVLELFDPIRRQIDRFSEVRNSGLLPSLSQAPKSATAAGSPQSTPAEPGRKVVTATPCRMLRHGHRSSRHEVRDCHTAEPGRFPSGTKMSRVWIFQVGLACFRPGRQPDRIACRRRGPFSLFPPVAQGEHIPGQGKAGKSPRRCRCTMSRRWSGASTSTSSPHW